MSRRWIRLDAEWDESGWLDALPGEVSGCWPKLLVWVKLRGKGGRCRRPANAVLAKKWNVSPGVVECLMMAGVHDEAIAFDGDDMVITAWSEYQEPDPTAAERKRQQREREAENGHAMSHRDTRDRGCDPSRDPRPPTVTEKQPPPPADDRFSEVWNVCKRGSRRQAEHQYRRVVPAKVSHEALLAAWKAHVSSASSPEYVAHLFRWIRDERWEEQVPEVPRVKAAREVEEWQGRKRATEEAIARDLAKRTASPPNANGSSGPLAGLVAKVVSGAA